ncbi:MAG: diguanylate cyclase [Dehalococcoidia bacterium]|nr:diguanylate cyclase [Dehalococcoidia bacterium]
MVKQDYNRGASEKRAAKGAHIPWYLRLDNALPIFTKVMGMVVVLTLIQTVVLIAIVLNVEHDAIQALYEERALTMSRLVGSVVLNGDQLEDQSHAQRDVTELVQINPALLRVNVYTAEAGQTRVWVSSTPDRVGKAGDAEDAAPLLTGLSSARDTHIDGQPALEVLAPVLNARGQILASVGVYMSTAPREAALQTLAGRVYLITGMGLIAVGIAFYSLPYRRGLKRIERITAAVRQMARGKLDTRVNEPVSPGARDEITILAAGFDQMASAIQKLQEKTEQLATTDGLTGLYNRRFFDEALHREIQRARRLNYPVTLLFGDIDRFKDFNDRYGHLAGDVALRNVATVLRLAVREVDVVARYGGEEFTIIFPGCAYDDAGNVAEKLRSAVEQARFAIRPSDGQETEAGVTVSVGAAVYPDTATSAWDLVAQADAAMYQAKQAGRNRVRVTQAPGRAASST